MPSTFEEQIKSREYLPAETPWRILVLAAVIFAFSIFIYLGMLLGYEPFLKSQIRTNESKISALTQSVDESKQKQVLVFYSQLVNIQNLLNSHKIVSPLFDFIERNTYQAVSYSNFKFNAAEREVRMDGIASDYETLVKEIALFNQAPEIEGVFLENSSVLEQAKGIKEVRFGIKFILAPDFFKQVAQTAAEQPSTREQPAEQINQ